MKAFYDHILGKWRQSDIDPEDASRISSVNNPSYTEVTGDSLVMRPWGNYLWTVTGTCFLSFDGWSMAGHERAYVLIQKIEDSVLVMESINVDGSPIGDAGTYRCEVENINGSLWFRVLHHVEA